MTTAPESPSEMPITIRDITLDPVRGSVERSGVEVRLTPREFDALQYLRNTRVVSRLLAALRSPGSGDDREHLRVLIGQLRKKLEDNAIDPEYIVTDSVIGYRFRDA